MKNTNEQHRAEYVAALRRMADWIEQHPTAPVPSEFSTTTAQVDVDSPDKVSEFAFTHDVEVKVSSGDGVRHTAAHIGFGAGSDVGGGVYLTVVHIAADQADATTAATAQQHAHRFDGTVEVAGFYKASEKAAS